MMKKNGTNVLNLADFYAKFMAMADKSLPAISHLSDKVVYFYIFARTVAVGQQSCRLSLKDISRLTGLSVPGLQSSLRRLTIDGFIKITQTNKRLPNIYEVLAVDK
jgi:hypothetical protein